MSTEKLPPDGYELGPGWRVMGTRHRCSGRLGGKPCAAGALYAKQRGSLRGGGWACVTHAETMGAIVRKADSSVSIHPAILANADDESTLTRPVGKLISATPVRKAPTFEQVLADATEAIAVIGTGKLRTELVTEGPRSYGQPVPAPFPVVASPEDLRVATERVSPRPRMPEAPTRLPPEVVAAIHASAEAPPEQPSGQVEALRMLERQIADAGIQPDRTPVSGDGDLFFHFEGSAKAGARASIVIHEQGEVTVEFTSRAGDGSFMCRDVAATNDGIKGALAEVSAFIAATCPPEQPSRNPLQLPPEAPAAPVGEPTGDKTIACLLKIIEIVNSDVGNEVTFTDDGGGCALTVRIGSCGCHRHIGAGPMLSRGAPEDAHYVARMVGDLRDYLFDHDCVERNTAAPIDPRDARIAALEAELAEAKAAMKRERVYVVEAEVSAAVQAERERGLYWRHRLDLTPDERTRRIKNGDPKP